MFRSLHMKLTLILLLLITSLMAVVGAFLTTSVTSFYIDSFYQQMSSAFGADRREFVADLRSAAAQPDGAERIQEIMEVNAGMLGIDYRTRNYYVLDGTAGSFLGWQRRVLRPAPGAVRQPSDRPERGCTEGRLHRRR